MKRTIEVTLKFEVESKSGGMKDDDHAFMAGFLSGVVSHAVEQWQRPDAHARITHWEWVGSKVKK